MTDASPSEVAAANRKRRAEIVIEAAMILKVHHFQDELVDAVTEAANVIAVGGNG